MVELIGERVVGQGSFVQELQSKHPSEARFIEQVYCSWMRVTAGIHEGDREKAEERFIESFTAAIPDSDTLRKFVDYSMGDRKENVRPELFACWVIFRGGLELEKFKAASRR